MMSARCRLAGGFFALFANTAHAAPGIGRFEPTDLKMAEPGELEVDTQVGIGISDGQADRLLLPDFELNLGLTRNVELDVDGSFLVEHYTSKSREYLGEPLWAGVKLGVLDIRDDAKRRAFAFGLQLGPLLPTTSHMRGIGYGALALAGIVRGRVQLVFNAGVHYAPRNALFNDLSPGRVVGGVDLRWAFDPRERWALLGEVGASVYWNHSAHEFSTTVGLEWSPSRHYSLSAVVLGNALFEGDKLSFLVGFTPRIRLF